jgi:hypothetical protein
MSNEGLMQKKEKYESVYNKKAYEVNLCREQFSLIYRDENNITEEIINKTFDDESEASTCYYDFLSDTIEAFVFNEDRLKTLQNKYDYDYENEGYIEFDLSAIGMIYDRTSDNSAGDNTLNSLKNIQTELGVIDSGYQLFRFTQWAVMFSVIQEGVYRSLESTEYKAISQTNKNWMVTAGEHDQIQAVINNVKDGKQEEPVNLDVLYVCKQIDAYSNIERLFLNREISYVENILMDLISSYPQLKEYYDYINQIDREEIIQNISKGFIDYYKSEKDFNMISFEWMAGKRNQRWANACPYKLIEE